MPNLSGNLKRVTPDPSNAVELWVSAPKVRPQQGVVLPEKTRVEVDQGQFSIDIMTGPAVLTVVYPGGFGDSIPLLVTSDHTTIEQAMVAANMADDHTQNQIVELIKQVQSLVINATDQAEAARSSASQAGASASQANQSNQQAQQARVEAQSANQQAQTAKTKAMAARDEANKHRQHANSYANSSQSSAVAAQSAQTGAESARDQSIEAAADAEQDRQLAQSAKDEAQQHANVANQHANRAEQAAESAEITVPESGWPKDSLAQPVQGWLTDVDNAVSDGRTGKGQLARFDENGMLRVPDPGSSTFDAVNRGHLMTQIHTRAPKSHTHNIDEMSGLLPLLDAVDSAIKQKASQTYVDAAVNEVAPFFTGVAGRINVNDDALSVYSESAGTGVGLLTQVGDGIRINRNFRGIPVYAKYGNGYIGYSSNNTGEGTERSTFRIYDFRAGHYLRKRSRGSGAFVMILVIGQPS